jgi:preprotein translocase subunit SecA
VLGTERHESRRIDNQLRGRSGRQGDPGETRFYLSLEDDLMRLFKADIVDSFLRRFNVPDDVPIEAKMVSKAILSAQTQVEGQNFEIRKNVLKYDEVMNRQRVVIYDERRRVLEGEDLHEQIRTFLDDTVEGYVVAETSEGYPEDWDYDRLWTALNTLYPVSVSADQVAETSGGGKAGLSQEFLVAELQSDAQLAYDLRERELGEDVTRELERRVVLSVLDRKWREHLYEMDYLQEGIGLRAYSQKDPLVEYQREGYELFNAMMDSIKEESVGYLFNVEVHVDQNAAVAGEIVREDEQVVGEVTAEEVLAVAEVETAPAITAKGLGPQRPTRLEYSAPSVDGEAGVVRSEEEIIEIPELGPDASRAERRRAERAMRKRDDKKR